VVAALTFIITNGAKYDVDTETFTKELNQLGLPKEHCDGLVKTFGDSKQTLREKLHSQVLRLDKLEGVDWRVDYVLVSNNVNNTNTPAVKLSLNLGSSDGETHKHTFEIGIDKFKALVNELQVARNMMDAIHTGPVDAESA